MIDPQVDSRSTRDQRSSDTYQRPIPGEAMPLKRHFLIPAILLLVAVLGFVGVRNLKPFREGYMSYSGPGSMESLLQVLASQIHLFKNQHGGKPPAPTALWEAMTRKSDSTELGDTPVKGTTYGPYLMHPMYNPLNGQTAVAGKPAPGVGWVYQVNGNDFTITAVNAAGDGVLTDDEAHLFYFRPSERAFVASQRAWNNWGGLLFTIPLAVYSLIYLACYGVIRIRRQRREAQGLCRICCYDLRASTHRCPECGTPFHAESPSPLTT
jgi:hypothetical protein